MYGTIRPNVKPTPYKDTAITKENNAAYAVHVAKRQEARHKMVQEMKEWMKKNK